MAQAGLKTIILLSFVLAISFLLVILSCALWSNWLPLIVDYLDLYHMTLILIMRIRAALIFAFAPLPNFVFSRCVTDDFSTDDYTSGPVDFGHFMTSVFLVSGVALPFALAHAGVIHELAGWMSAIGGIVGYATRS
ncbi:Vacuolar protein sorting-associated protein 55 [Microbotryomycetes sp. JL221]|nr:Vacuolar protein sorting-associated protein 55 [Microbotryomycetes sp. JL221]